MDNKHQRSKPRTGQAKGPQGQLDHLGPIQSFLISLVGHSILWDVHLLLHFYLEVAVERSNAHLDRLLTHANGYLARDLTESRETRVHPPLFYVVGRHASGKLLRSYDEEVVRDFAAVGDPSA